MNATSLPEAGRGGVKVGGSVDGDGGGDGGREGGGGHLSAPHGHQRASLFYSQAAAEPIGGKGSVEIKMASLVGAHV